jgi:hypothetical protein
VSSLMSGPPGEVRPVETDLLAAPTRGQLPERTSAHYGS